MGWGRGGGCDWQRGADLLLASHISTRAAPIKGTFHVAHPLSDLSMDKMFRRREKPRNHFNLIIRRPDRRPVHVRRCDAYCIAKVPDIWLWVGMSAKMRLALKLNLTFESICPTVKSLATFCIVRSSPTSSLATNVATKGVGSMNRPLNALVSVAVCL